MDNKMELDQLRTAMANERTFLAYLRTALSFVAFGLIMIRFFPESKDLLYGGAISIVIGVAIFAGGVYFYLNRKKKYSK